MFVASDVQLVVDRCGWFAGGILVPFELPSGFGGQPLWAVAIVSSFWVLHVWICLCPRRWGLFLYRGNSVEILFLA